MFEGGTGSGGYNPNIHTTADTLANMGDTAALGRCLRGLDARQRQAIALAFYEGLSHAELAHHLRQPLGTVKTWVRRGLARLRACLELQR